MERIQIVSVSDDNYAKHLSVMLVSLLKNTSYSEYVDIHIVYDNYSEDTQVKLQSLISSYGARSFFYQVDPSLYSALAVRNISHAAYYKLSIPDILQMDKVIFLDCDMVIIDDIYNLWKFDITDYFLAAVREGQFNRYDQLKMPHGSDYFNSGVMLINLIKWREYNISQVARQFLSEHSENLKYHDQEGFNAALHKYPWIKLPPKWNQLSSMFRWSFSEMRFEEAEYHEALISPSIVHYSGDSKPWHYLHSGDMKSRPFKDEYLHYLQFTPWRDDVYPEKALFDRKVIVFGTGSLSEQLSEQLSEKGHKIAYYIDNSIEKIGTSFLGLPVNSPTQLLSEDKDGIVILIASSAFNEIAAQLVGLGFKAGEHFIGGKGIRKYR